MTAKAIAIINAYMIGIQAGANQVVTQGGVYNNKRLAQGMANDDEILIEVVVMHRRDYIELMRELSHANNDTPVQPETSIQKSDS